MKSWLATWVALTLLTGAAALSGQWIRRETPGLSDADLSLYAGEVQRITATAAARPGHYSARRALCALMNYADMRSEATRSRLPAPTSEELAAAWAEYERYVRPDAQPVEWGNLRTRYEEV